MIKTCKNCAYRDGSTCMYSGYSWRTERQYPSRCGKDYTAWIQKPTFIDVIISKLSNKFGCKNENN